MVPLAAELLPVEHRSREWEVSEVAILKTSSNRHKAKKSTEKHLMNSVAWGLDELIQAVSSSICSWTVTFITICTQNRLYLLGKNENGTMILNEAGRMVATVWNEIPRHYSGFAIHEFVVMPNHSHGIIEIVTMIGAGPRACPGGTCNRSPRWNMQSSCLPRWNMQSPRSNNHGTGNHRIPDVMGNHAWGKDDL
ncbi:hypothetical protein EDC14_1014108 [Hydrogenispora ethanolica]|uniref:Transposase IS200-like domain-containing protein n=1 Tax=Hydrogenispora ethanolica TaxID=1082276 RepID=A0A4R1RMC6_HYDET|nr:transposase [Hydrogenispora ethanolica]TCL67418.1 hypothetical protein EDC14_1014108 [Hydrogenispora ethanolica]